METGCGKGSRDSEGHVLQIKTGKFMTAQRSRVRAQIDHPDKREVPGGVGAEKHGSHR